MPLRHLAVLVRSDAVQAWRRGLAQGPVRLTGTAVGGVALIAAEVWIAHHLASRLLGLPVVEVARTVLAHGVGMATELAMIVATASAATLALPVLERIETDPWWAATPVSRPLRALQTWWRVGAGLGWILVLAGPLVITLELHLDPGPTAAVAAGLRLLLLTATAAALGSVLALVLASCIPRRVLLPLSWTLTTAAVVGSVLWLRGMHPERIITTTDPEELLTSLVALAANPPRITPMAWMVPGADGSMLPMIIATAAAVTALVALWFVLSPLAAARLATGTGAHIRPARPWQWLDRLLVRGPTTAILASRLRLLLRDLTQASQTLYLLGLGAVYVENLRSLPLEDPLARELAGLINLAMAGLLTAALSLRFAYPAHLLEDETHWWWSTGPIVWWRRHLAVATVALLPPVLLSGSLFTASLLVTGPGHATAVGWWLVPWQAVWLTLLGVTLGPRAAESRHSSWVDVALGGGGLLFLALAVAGIGWTIVGAGRWVIAEVLYELGGDWQPGLLLGHPIVPAAILSMLPLAALAWRARRAT
jgi:hypothetical protein